jgi:hypothetical protein
MKVERITWDYTGEYNVKKLGNDYLVCTEDSVCFIVHDANGIDDAIKAVEEYAKSEFT